MKKWGCALLGCFGALGVVFALIFVLAWLAPEGTGGGEGEPYQEVESLNRFERVEEGATFRLTYSFIDYSGRTQKVTCTVSRDTYEREVEGYGYVERQANAEINRLLEARMREEGTRRGVLSYFKIEMYGQGGYRWEWNAPEGSDARLLEQIQDFHTWLENDFPAEAKRLTGLYFESRGLRLKGDKIEVDYRQAVERATAPLGDCFEALERAGGRDSERRRLGLFLAFFQELRYELPPERDGRGRFTLGFRVPSAVMVQGAGDCDSKAAAFCALWRHFPRRVILILVPEHALVGVEGKPRADEAYVRLGNRYFILCEVAGPGKIPPGGEAISGNFEYVMIEPIRGSAAG